MTDITKTCRVSGVSFVVSDKDQAFYEKMKVPAPSLCPDERQRRRLSWRNEKNLYASKCELCQAPMISAFPADSEFTVYCQKCWWGDSWDPMRWGRDFDFERPFFEQFAKLMHNVPMVGLMNAGPTLENSDYVNYMSHAKNCYLIFASNFLEDCMYSEYLWESKDSFDCSFCTKLELCYECIDCDRLYGCKYLQNCKGCNDCVLGFGLRNCQDCFGCVNLNGKQFYYFNEQLSEAEYKKRMTELDDEKLGAEMRRFEEFVLQFPRKFAHQINCENSTGDSIKNCRNVQHCFDGYGGEDLKWMVNFPGDTKDCYDISGCAQIELAVDGHALFPGYNFRYCNNVLNGGSNQTYCAYTDNGESLFGCIGTKRAKHCILNKQYSPGEYEDLVVRIIEHMKKTGEWGEFFPAAISPFAYNETLANDWFPLSKDEALANGYKWKEKAMHVADESQVSDNVRACGDCGKAFRTVDKELEFYEKQNLSVPEKCPHCRYKVRFKKRPARKLWARDCDKCSVEMQSIYSPELAGEVYCEKCYLEEVY